MKIRAPVFVKQVISLLGSVAKPKSLALKSKINATKAWLVLFEFMKNKKLLLSSISHKIHALLAHESCEKGEGISSDHEKAIFIYNALANEAPSDPCCTLHEVDVGGEDDGENYPDLTHSLFHEIQFDNESRSAIDLVRNSHQDGSEFNLEEEIDHVADVFIERFHKQMKMQKLASFKRYLEMLDRSV